jgi:hypothetical protein
MPAKTWAKMVGWLQNDQLGAIRNQKMRRVPLTDFFKNPERTDVTR